MSGDLIPVSDEQAKAITELAKFGTTSVEAARNLGGFLARLVGTVPEDIIGLLLGDGLHYARVRAQMWYQERVDSLLRDRGVKETTPVSPSLALPLLKAAQDETREQLRELWARLLANAMDPSRAHVVRQAFIDVLKAFEPLDARALQALHETTTLEISDYRQQIAIQLGISLDEFAVSVENLAKLGCLNPDATRPKPFVSPFGRELLRALAP